MSSETIGRGELSESQPQSPASSNKRRQLLIAMLLSLGTVLVALAALELVGFFWERNTAQGPLGWTLVASRRLELERHGSESMPYYLMRADRQYNWEGIDVVINSQGLRAPETSVPKSESDRRILNVGDSVAFGWEVEASETYGRQLEAALNATVDGHNYEVINAGVPTWNLEAARNFIAQEGLTYDPDLLVLDVTVVNDIFGRGPEVLETQGIVPWLRDHTHFWPFLTTQMRFMLARQQGPEAFATLNPPRDADAYYPLDAEDSRWERFWTPINDIATLANDAGVPVVLIVFPTAFQLNSSAHPDVPQQVLRKRTAERDIAMVDLLVPYAAACDAAAPNACEGYENLLFADVWMHPNATGHHIAAQELLPLVQTILGEE